VKPNPRKLLRFGAQFLPLFALFLWLYWLILPSYEPAVLNAANAIGSTLSPASRMDATADEWSCTITQPSGEERQLKRWYGFLRHLLFLDLALVPALLLPTPVALRVRLRLAGLGIVLVYVGHVIAVLALMRGMWCLVESPGNFVCNWILRIAYTSGQLFGAAIWGALAWRYWFPADLRRSG
jgi:hypothetical protein